MSTQETPTPPTIRAAISELRRHGGLSWDELGLLFGIDRSTVSLWACGIAISARDEEHLRQLLATLRFIDRGFASENRALLLRPVAGGLSPFDLLAVGRDAEAAAAIGPGAGPRRRAPRISAEARAARAPQPPEELVDALQDRPHGSESRLIRATPLGLRRRMAPAGLPPDATSPTSTEPASLQGECPPTLRRDAPFTDQKQADASTPKHHPEAAKATRVS